jgi:E3 ubiquitin-protein ligase RBBP6
MTMSISLRCLSLKVLTVYRQAYMEGKKPSVPPEEVEAKPTIPEELVCSICRDLLTDTVMIPCCGSSFCDECESKFQL